MCNSYNVDYNAKFWKKWFTIIIIIINFFGVGSEFNNAVVDELFRMSGVKHRISSSYHPQTNGKNNTTVLLIW